jgi:hypothetical protein
VQRPKKGPSAEVAISHGAVILPQPKWMSSAPRREFFFTPVTSEIAQGLRGGFLPRNDLRETDSRPEY